MVYIITGPVNSGKTTHLGRICMKTGSGDGFLLEKQIVEGRFIGQRIKRVGAADGHPFTCKTDHIPPGWDEMLSYGNFSFSREGLEYAHQIIREAVEKKRTPIFIDEIGPLELSGKCFDELMKLALSIEADLFITVRDTCLNQVVNRYRLDSYCIVLK